MDTKAGNGIRLIKYEDDITMVPHLITANPAQTLKDIHELAYKPGDVMLCTYPKCGSHWVGNMILRLKDIPIDNTKLALCCLDIDSTEDITSLDAPRLVFTHLWPKRLPEDHVINGGKTVLVFRNPKDVAVSFYYHLKNAFAVANKQTWDEFCNSFFEGCVPWWSYIEYIEAWNRELMQKSLGVNIEVFFYEDFITDSLVQIKRLAKYLEVDKSDTQLEEILKECSMENLRELSKNGVEHKGLLDKDGITVIFRKGKIGDWKEHFTVAQNERFGTMLEENKTLKDLNFKYTM